MTLARSGSLVPYEGAVEVPPLSMGDYQALKVALAAGPTGHRDVLIAQVLFGTGLRIGEVLRAHVEHLTYRGPDAFLMVRREKKALAERRWEHVALHPEIAAALADYVRGHGRRRGQPIFEIKTRMVANVFARASQRLGRRITPHMLRGLYVTYLAEQGVPLGVVSKLVGHTNERTTLQWYMKLTTEKRAEIARRLPV